MGESTDGIVLKHLQTLYSVGAIGGLSDGQLGDRVHTGGDDTAEAAFTILAERHGPMVLRICRQMLSDRHEAEDAFQATFLVLARKAHAIRNRDSVAGWLHGVARRVALRAKADAARRQIKERRAATLAVGRSPENNEGQSESWPELHEEIARLPERYREPVVLCYLEGLTTEAASQRLGCPKGTVLSRLSRAKERLRRSLTRRGVVIPAGMLAVEWSSDIALAIPTTLLETTVRASLNFTARQAAGASLASTTAVGLARGVLYAMTLSQWKTFGAATLACIFTLGGLQAFAQFGGIGVADEASTVKPAADDRQAALSQSVAKIQAELDEANRRNAELQKQLQAIQTELKTLQTGPTSAPTKEAKPKGLADKAAEAAEPQGRDITNGSSPNFRHRRSDEFIFMISRLGDKFKTFNTRTGRTSSLELPASKEFPLEITPLTDVQAAAFKLKGQRITQLFASNSLEGPWFTQDLREPVNGTVSPIIRDHQISYHVGRYVYTFSSIAKRWAILELPEGKQFRLDNSNPISFVGDDHIYTFDVFNGEWKDLNIKAIFDAPDNKGPDDAKLPLPQTRLSPQSAPSLPNQLPSLDASGSRPAGP
ncbi:sigma-70 family RNA polymerase sigma factor [Singulisphaera acidiphila]|uniref:RNA polymerase sigma factor, sigma-70 family n=1 Tax=Singulisphaera acidiphila (strain ATCC BAA-1392 / DSM 18658 / VKM B-2454 / MOB10) TaxID=886293 RepID=L0DR85_SINAD|nr:sigma-70 family RNA polymerase sigma factor [Singulisphaera acidiphila]AGA31487.1 RNA polymerase sigma factor, sigma-70 family [Singulisphaera acidiphila DSM 18658]